MAAGIGGRRKKEGPRISLVAFWRLPDRVFSSFEFHRHEKSHSGEILSVLEKSVLLHSGRQALLLRAHRTSTQIVTTLGSLGKWRASNGISGEIQNFRCDIREHLLITLKAWHLNGRRGDQG